MSGDEPPLYRVVITTRAHQEMAAYGAWIAMDSWQAADRWLSGLSKLIDGLKSFPNRYGIAREASHRGRVLRQVIYHSHRLLFTVDDERMTVTVHRVIHTAMQQLRRYRP